MNAMTTKPARYDKNSLVYINGKEYTLIDFLSEKRKEKNLTKKFISLTLKNNDYWYSQIEMGKIDNNRRRFINRNDLIEIISVIIFDARTPFDLERTSADSVNYIDSIMNATPYDLHPRYIPTYEIEKNLNFLYDAECANERVNEYLNAFNNSVRDFYLQCDNMGKSAIVNLLGVMIANMRYNPIMTLHYCGLPFSAIFNSHGKDSDSQKKLEKEFMSDVNEIMKKYSELLYESDIESITKKLLYLFERTDLLLKHQHNNSLYKNNENEDAL